MSDSKTFHGVTQELFNLLRIRCEQEQGTVFDPPNANAGAMTTKGTGWTVVLAFAFTPATGELFCELRQKSWIVPTGAIWAGLSDTLDSCRQV